MKLLTAAALALLFISATCQEPDLCGYSENTVNEIKAVVDSCLYVIETQEYLLEMHRLSDMAMETSVVADTYNFEVVDDLIKVEVNKVGHDVWVDIFDGVKTFSIALVDSTIKVE